MFYAIGHMSRFLAAGSRRLWHKLINSRYDYPIEAAVYLTADERHLVIVICNTNRHDVKVRIVVDKRLVRDIRIRAESFNTAIFRWTAKN